MIVTPASPELGINQHQHQQPHRPQLCKNWAENVAYSSRVDEVTTVDQIKATLLQRGKVKAAGTGHTFNFIADSLFTRLSLRLLREVLHLDAAERTVTVQAGIRYDQLCPYLERNGFALPNLASVLEISIVGACSTGAHGSGDKNPSLATSVSALEMLTADGELVKLSRKNDGELFLGAVVGLGAVGVITQITLDIQPAYTMRQYVYENLPSSQLREHFDTIMSSGYSVSLFTNWQQERIAQTWIKTRDDDDGNNTFAAPQDYFGATLQKQNLLIVESHVGHFAAQVVQLTEQMGVPGASYKRLPHFHAGSVATVGRELQSEYFVPRHHAVDAIMAIERLGDQITPHLIISEIRTIAADDLWMSPCYRRDSVSIAFTWKHEWPAVRLLLPIIERELTPFDFRPHWGKLFNMAPVELQPKWEKLEDFRHLVRRFDPKGKFRNEFLDTNIFI